MYNNPTGAAVGVSGVSLAAAMPFAPGLSWGEPLWMVLGSFALLAAGSAVRRIAPTWRQMTGESLADEDRAVQSA